MQDFVHLHVHTQYSILDGQASISRLIDKAVKNGMRGFAVTDHGNMMGIKEFYDTAKKTRAKGADALAEARKTLEQLESDGSGATETQLAEARREVERQKRVAGFMPIFGCEMYVARRGKEKQEEKADMSGYHLIVLAKNNRGYHNLVKLVSRAWVDGFYMRPRTDHADLERYSEGLMVCSACIAGEVPQKILAGDLQGAEEAVLWHKRVFGDDYYLELQRHKVPAQVERANREAYEMQQQVNPVLMQLAAKHGVKVICSNDVHFVDEDNAEAHDRLICLSTGKDLNDPKRMVYSKQEWFKTREEMNELFADVPEALANTVELLEKTEFYSIDHAPIMPNFPIPEDFDTEESYRSRFTPEDLFNEFTRDENGNEVLSREEAEQKIEKLGGTDKLYRIKLEADYLAKLAYEGAERRYGSPLPERVREQVKFELHIMKTMGFPGYFLIVQDYIAAARRELNVSVGPGRGSAAGSVVAYCLGITQIDPIKYDLLFERFLNPDRISLPDIDVDFDDDGRDRVLQWVTQKYGEANVAHIITYGTMATKSAIKDVARVEKLPLQESNRLCKLIPDSLPEGPDGKSPKLNLPNAIAYIKELKEASESDDPLLRETLRYAVMLEGNIRNTGVHACGFIICRDPISDWVPVSVATDTKTGQQFHCTQYEGKVIEDTGLIKMDFLGLKTLTILREALENIRQGLHIEIDLEAIDIKDPATYQLFCEGNTVGIFQFESKGMQRSLRELQPSTFEDLIAMNALYRPGPMQYIPQFIARKHGRQSITYDLPCMKEYLQETYGITVYQEQVMLLSRKIANFTRGESDNLRKAMGKKLINKLNHMYPKFIEGGKKNGYDEKVLEKIWNDWRAFASYAFNKSHATCYSWIAFQTAYLKAHFPAHYMAAVMSCNLNAITEIAKLMDECKSMGIRTLIPDINESGRKFSVNASGAIRFGLAAIKGVGNAAADHIIEERRQNGLYTSPFNFIERVKLTIVNRKTIESLVLAGAFDSFEPYKREQYFAADSTEKGDFIDALILYGNRFQEDKRLSGTSLFGGFAAVEIAHPEFPEAYEPWDDLRRLNRERDLIGLYISSHPLDEFRAILEHVCTTRCAELEDKDSLKHTNISIGGIVSSVRTGLSNKSGKPYGIVRLEDYHGSGELALWGDNWARWSGYLQEGCIVHVSAVMKKNTYKKDGSFNFSIQSIDFLDNVKEDLVRKLSVGFVIDELEDGALEEFTRLVKESPGKGELIIHVLERKSGLRTKFRSASYQVAATNELIDFLENTNSVSYKIN